VSLANKSEKTKHKNMETREIFRHFPLWMQLVFYVIAFATIAFFIVGFYRKYKKYKKGRDAGRFNNLGARFGKAMKLMAGNATIFKRDKFAGWAHLMIFWGFIVLLIGTTIIAIDHDLFELVFHFSILKGTFYLIFSLFMDVFGLLFIIGLIMMMVRRKKKPAQLDYARSDMKADQYDRSGYKKDDVIFMWLLLLIGISGFFIEGLRIAADRPPYEIWSPVGWQVANIIDVVNITAVSDSVFPAVWWGHTILVMLFIGYIPYSKGVHMLVDFANLMFIDEQAGKKLPRVTEEKMKEGMGYTKISDFTWKELLDFDACTKCGRCHTVCPANAAGTPLSPRDIILDMRTYADTKSSSKEWFTQTFTNGKAKKEPEIADGVIAADRLWSCTTCMACIETCPVGVEHLTTIVNLRRTLVDEGNMEDMLQDALMNIGDYGNSFGKSDRMRARWTKDLDFKIKDARKEPVEILWFVGDYASFDARGQEISRKVANVLNNAGLDFGILYDGERNSGNDVRRVGEEGLFEMLAEDNVAAFEEAGIKEIFTTDPHSLNTIRNEYSDFGGDYTVHHYTSLLLKLINEGKIKISNKLDYKVTYHDPCYLGRYNGETENPRKLLETLGVKLSEMPRNRENSFCCGAGGGRIWMDDSKMEERPSENRIKEALTLGDVDVFVVSCPKDYAMFTDAVKTSGNEDKIRVMDIIDLVAEAI